MVSPILESGPPDNLSRSLTDWLPPFLSPSLPLSLPPSQSEVQMESFPNWSY